MEISSILGTVRLSICVGCAGGKIWHEAIEFVGHRIDRWLWNYDWAWANDRRYRH